MEILAEMILDKTSAAIYTTLTGSTALTALLNDATSVYDTQAPEGASLDYVVFSLQAGGPEVVTGSEIENNLWFVRVYSTSAKKASEAFEKVDALLHRKNITIGSGVTWWCAREENVKNVEVTPSGQLIWMAGGIYRIRTSGV
jgi:hypothetical protein